MERVESSDEATIRLLFSTLDSIYQQTIVSHESECPSDKKLQDLLDKALSNQSEFRLKFLDRGVSLISPALFFAYEEGMLWRDMRAEGCLELSLESGLSEKELWSFLKGISSFRQSADVIEDDLGDVLAPAHVHVNIKTDVCAEERPDKVDPENWSRFLEGVTARTKSVGWIPSRRMRLDDVKVLEEFRLNPGLFISPPDSVSKAIESVRQWANTSENDRSTIERLLGRGFHFLLDVDEETRRLGRQLILKAAQGALRSRFFDLYDSVYFKLLQLQKIRESSSGEYQKVIDRLYHTDQLRVFNELFQNSEAHKPLSAILLQGPPVTVRLLILLLGHQPWLAKSGGDFLFRHLGNHLSWLLSEVERDPQDPSWPILLKLLSTRSGAYFSRFVSAWLHASSAEKQQQILELCAEIGSSDALEPIADRLKSESIEIRMRMYPLLRKASNHHALRILREFLSTRIFEESRELEKKECLKSILALARENAWPWIESLWLQGSSGFFKRNLDRERHAAVIGALQEAQPSLLPRLTEKVPLERLKREVRELLEKALKAAGKEATS